MTSRLEYFEPPESDFEGALVNITYDANDCILSVGLLTNARLCFLSMEEG